MRLAILADIHGNFRALEAVLADLARIGADEVVSLGDNIGYGPEPEEVVRTLRQHGVVSVMGNHELALISCSYHQRMQESARVSLTLTRDLLSADSLAWLAQLPPVRMHRGIRLVHGCPPDSMTVYLFSPSANRLARLFAAYPEWLCCAGHTHGLDLFESDCRTQPFQRKLGLGRHQLDPATRYILMPGSVGQPRDSISRQAKYLLWDTESLIAEVRAVAYDVATTIRLLEERHFPAVNGRRLAG